MPLEVSVRDAVLRELHEAGLLFSARGNTALGIAERMDSGQETGHAFAALSRELFRLMPTVAQVRAEDPVDDLAAKRAARIAGVQSGTGDGS